MTWVLAYILIGIAVEGLLSWKVRHQPHGLGDHGPLRYVAVEFASIALWPIGVLILACHVEYDPVANKIVSPAWLVKRR